METRNGLDGQPVNALGKHFAQQAMPHGCFHGVARSECERCTPAPTSRAALPGSEREAFDLTQIPYHAEVRIGRIFVEGDHKYHNRVWSEDGATLTPGNWHTRVRDKRYQLERGNHALKHLKIYLHWLEFGEYLGEAGEDDLAKVAWFCVTQMELERREGRTS